MKYNIFSQLYASILVNAIYAMKNYPVMLVNTLLAPLSILVIITFVSHGSLLVVGIMGALISTLMSSGMSLQGDLSHLKNDFKLQDMVVSSPTSASIYILGMAISELIYSIPAIATILILAFIYVHMTLLGAVYAFIALVLVFTFSIALGFTLSTYTSDVMQSWALSGIISTLFSTVPPVYYPITYIPLPYRYLAYISPTTYAAEIIQNAIGFIHLAMSAIAIDWIVLIAISAVLIAISAKKSRWREI